MMELPLFPLGTVLFPGMPLPLHIFEPRYQQMISFCIEQKSAFVVALIRSGREALGPVAETFEVGCTARIREVSPIGEGRLNLQTIGAERVRVLSINNERDYAVCQAEAFPSADQNAITTEELAAELRPLIHTYIKILTATERVEIPNLMALPPTKLIWLAADLLQIRPGKKQQLLEEESLPGLYDKVRAAYLSEIALLSAIADQKQANADGHPNSLN